MDGIILINKPQGFTSFDVVAKLRGLLHTKKVGHSGTLDPMATGLLPILVGRGTKCCDIMPCQDKRYRAVLRLGVVTDTLDTTGTILKTQQVHATQEQVKQVLRRFVGEIEQVPPMYSAIQINGQRLYDLARRGIEVERAARPVTIYHCELLGEGEGENEYILDVACSKGTYIRTLCADIGQALGCGAAMSGLCRTQAAGFSLCDAITLEQAAELARQGKLEEHILPVERVFETLPKIELSQVQTRMYRNGVRLDCARIAGLGRLEGDLRVYGHDGTFLGIGFVRGQTGELCSRQLFAVAQA